MNSKANSVLIDIENGPDSFMIIGREKGKILTDLIVKYQPKNILEIGTNLGYSSILMGMHLPEGGKITTLELHPKSLERANENIKKAGMKNLINMVVGKAQETIKTLPGMYDFLFIDAAKIEYLTYLKLAEGKLSQNAVIVADNVGVFADDVKTYTDYVKNSGKYISETVTVGGDAMEISIISSQT